MLFYDEEFERLVKEAIQNGYRRCFLSSNVHLAEDELNSIYKELKEFLKTIPTRENIKNGKYK